MHLRPIDERHIFSGFITSIQELWVSAGTNRVVLTTTPTAFWGVKQLALYETLAKPF